MSTEATELARRSDALYYDNISRRELCDMVARLESALDGIPNVEQKRADMRSKKGAGK